MKNTGKVLGLIILILFAANYSFAQTLAANKSWNSFWVKFSSAVKNKHFNALNALTLKPFTTSGIEDTLAEFYNGYGKNQFWRAFSESVNSGTSATDKIDGRPVRTSNNEYLLFVYTKNGWRLWGLWGD